MASFLCKYVWKLWPTLHPPSCSPVPLYTGLWGVAMAVSLHWEGPAIPALTQNSWQLLSAPGRLRCGVGGMQGRGHRRTGWPRSVPAAERRHPVLFSRCGHTSSWLLQVQGRGHALAMGQNHREGELWALLVLSGWVSSRSLGTLGSSI